MVTPEKRPAKGKQAKAKAKAKVAPKEVQTPSAETATREGKSIFLFADGTGNSSAKLFKTNVWRMYEAIDFGAACKGRHVQVGYYDNGVGTSSFRPLAMLGGIFGIGLKNNVLRLYTFLCRNYRPGDRIYVFGFSRGAFTIRLLVALVADQGILMPAGRENSLSYQVREASLSRQVSEAYRDFRRIFVPNLPFGRLLVALGRGMRDVMVGGIGALWHGLLRRPRPEPPARCYADIEFVGVWDTVAAYGGPFAEFTRGVDDWVFPLTMPNYWLNPKIKKARHALSLDDERDAFWPLLWDEVHERDLIANGEPVTIGRTEDGKPIQENRKVDKDRLKQVWFAGVHSDVGGGYPDESLSYIPLLWMMDELGNDVEFLRPFVERARDLANPYGPIHDSRAGLAAYYRYQPRKIAAFMDQSPPVGESTISLRQPDRDSRPAWQGLLKSVCVHESVIARIISGIDNYAPAALPASFDIVGSTGPRAIPSLTAANYETLKEASKQSQLRFDHQENAWDWVWARRLVYFATILVTGLLILAPWTTWLQSLEQLCSDDRCFARSFVDLALFVVPQGIRNTLDPWASVPLVVIILGIVILILISWGRRTERRFRDRVRKIWRDYLHESGNALVEPKKRWRVRTIRENLIYQGVIFVVKWQLLPTLCGLAALVAVLYGIVIASTQVLYAFAEPRDWSCKTSSQPVTDLNFKTTESCKDLGVELKQGTPYRLTIKAIPETATDTIPWLDDTLPADPRRGVTDRHAMMMLAAPLKRVTSANWLQVITEVRAPNPNPWTHWAFPTNIDLRKHQFTFLGKQTYETTLCPRWDGRLFILLNDAAPLLSKRFYENNHGSAEVSVAPAPDKQCT